MKKPDATTFGLIATIVFGLPTWWALFIEHPETLGAVMQFFWFVLRYGSPLIMLVCGGLVGRGLAKQQSLKQVEDKDAEIAELKKRPTQEQLEAANRRIAELKRNLTGKTQAASDLDSTCRSLQEEMQLLKANIQNEKYSIDRFSPAQVKLLLDILENEGPRQNAVLSKPEPAIDSLRDSGVVQSVESADDGKTRLYISPEWRPAILRQRQEMERIVADCAESPVASDIKEIMEENKHLRRLLASHHGEQIVVREHVTSKTVASMEQLVDEMEKRVAAEKRVEELESKLRKYRNSTEGN